MPNDAQNDHHHLPENIYRLRVIAGIGVAVVAGGVLILIVNLSQSVSGSNIVTLFGTLIAFLTFVFLSISDPISRPKGALDVTDLITKIGAGIVLGVLGNILYALLAR